jgi:hypothetical protein
MDGAVARGRDCGEEKRAEQLSSEPGLPQGKNTALSARLNDITRQFIAQGASESSKVVDANGEPSPGNNGDFSTGKPSILFLRERSSAGMYDPEMPMKINKISGKEIGDGPLSASRIKEWALREQQWQDAPPVINADTGNPHRLYRPRGQ